MEKQYQRSFKIIISVCFISLFFFIFQIQGYAVPDIDVDTFLGIKVPTAAAWSPDGTHIAFQVKNFMGNEIHVYCLHEAKIRKLVSDIPPYGYLEVTTYQNPEPLLRWTPDGQRIIYTTGKDLYSVPLHGGGSELLFESPKNAKLIQLSPDIKSVSYIEKGELWIQSLEGGEPKQLTKKGGFLTNDYQRFSRLIQWPQWSPDGSKIACLWPHKGGMKIGVVSIVDGETTWLIPEESIWGFFILKWSPDSAQIAVSMLSADFKRKELAVFGASGDFSHTIWKDADDKWVSHNIDPSFSVAWSHDSSRLAFLSNRDGWKHLYVSDPGGDTAKQLTRGDFKDYLCFWAPDSGEIFFVSNKGNHHQRLIWAVPSGGGEVRQVIKNTGVCLGNVAGRGWALPHCSPDGKKIVYTFTDPFEPPGLWIGDTSEQNEPEQLYSSLPEDMPGGIKTQMKPVEFSSSDGTRIPAVLLMSKDLNQNEKHPALVYMYGGWGQNALLGWALEIKTLLFNYLAHKGYVILIVDPRGSEGYGEELARGLYLEAGGKQVDALMKADKEFDYMVYPQEPHGWIKPEVKRDFFRRVERFLDRYLRCVKSD